MASTLFHVSLGYGQTIPYTNNFATTDTSFHLHPTGDTLAWKGKSNGGVSNSQCLVSEYVTNSTGGHANEYFASKRLYFVEGNTYSVSFKSKVQFDDRRKIKIAINTVDDRSSATLVHDFGLIENIESYETFTHTISVESSGYYYLIYFGELEGSNKPCKWYTDDFSVTLVNTPPSASLVGPTNNSYYNPEQSVTATATTSDAESNVAKIEFYLGATKVGEDETPNGSGEYTLTFVPSNGGSQLLTAKAIDTYSASGTSSSRTINVRYKPQATITNITTNAIYFDGMQLVTANASDTDGSIEYVVFYVNNDSIGIDSTTPYSFTVPLVYDENNTQQFVKVKAVDDDGLTGVDIVEIKVFAKPCSLTTPNSLTTQIICPGDSITLASDGGEGSTGFQWVYMPFGSSTWEDIESTRSELVVRNAGLYSIIWYYENNATCMPLQDSLYIDSIKARTVIGIDYSNGVAHAVSKVVSGYGPYSFSWTNVDGSYELAIGDSAIIDSIQYHTWVTITDSVGCVTIDTAYSPVFGRTMAPLLLANITDPPCTLSGSNLLCNGSFEATNATTDPFGGTGANPNLIQNWGSTTTNTEFDFSYLSLSGASSCANCPNTNGAFDLPCNVWIENSNSSNCSTPIEVSPPTGGSDKIIAKSVFTGPTGSSTMIGQKLNATISKGEKYVVRFSARYSRRAQFRPKKFIFMASTSTTGQLPFEFTVNTPNDPNSLYNWQNLSSVFEIPSSLSGSFDQIFLGNIGAGNPFGFDNENFWYVELADVTRDLDNLAAYLWDFTFFDKFFISRLPKTACSQMVKSSASVALGLNENSTWLSDFISNTGATFSWTPTTGLTNANTASPTANPETTTTYTCKMTMDGVEYTIGTTQVQVIDGSDITFSQNICSDYVTIGNTFPSGTTFVWTKPDNSTTTSSSFNIGYPLTSGNSLSVVVTGSCAGNSATVATTIPGSGLTQTDPTTLGDNPRACCGTLTKTINQNCTDDVDANSKKDYFHSFTLSKYCGLYPSIYLSTKDCGFSVSTSFQYKKENNTWGVVSFSAPEGNGTTYSLTSSNVTNELSQIPTSICEFRVHIESVSTSPSGNFDLKLETIEATSNGGSSCDNRFVSCCRIANEPDLTKMENLQLIVYPNPANKEFTIGVISEEIGEALVEIVDLNGRPVFHQFVSSEIIKVSTKDIPQGLYLVRCSKAGQITNTRLSITY